MKQQREACTSQKEAVSMYVTCRSMMGGKDKTPCANKGQLDQFLARPLQFFSVNNFSFISIRGWQATVRGS